MLRPDEVDQERLERALGQFMARYLSPGANAGVRMFSDLFRIVTDSVPPEVAAVFRALATLLPMLRRLPRRVERIASAAEHGRLSVHVRLFADEPLPSVGGPLRPHLHRGGCGSAPQTSMSTDRMISCRSSSVVYRPGRGGGAHQGRSARYTSTSRRVPSAWRTGNSVPMSYSATTSISVS
jgi:hypothetical protein